MQTKTALTTIIALLFFTGISKAQITQVENLFGKYTLSVDGCENNNGTGQAGSCPIVINKPAGATLFKAYLVASLTAIDFSGFPATNPLRVNTTNTYAGSIAPTLSTLSLVPGAFRTRYINATTDLAAMLNGLPSGPSSMFLMPDSSQSNNASSGLEGRTLIVIWNDPNGTDKVISLALGATTSLPATTFTVNTPPLSLASPVSTAIAGIGINFSSGIGDQVNNVSVNSSIITTVAGDQDDGDVINGLVNGNLFTIGDDADVLSLTSEKYDIKPFLVNASTAYTVTFENVLGHSADYFSIYYSVVSDAFQSGTISGTLYNDVNTNLIFNTGEPTLPANITVFLYRDIDGVPGLNTATDQLVASTVTDAAGIYTFSGVTVGTNYILQVNTTDPDIPAGFSIETPNPVLNVVSNNAATSTVDFGFTTTTPCDPATNITNSAAICANQTYQLPWGTTVSTSGAYSDTIRNAANTCDSIITTINLTVYSVSLINTNVHICPGQTYQLPSGTIVNTPGNYSDTIRNQASCDSIIRTIQLFVDQASFVSTNPHICPGQTYQLPSGTIVNTTGTYVDTLRSQASCDSIIATTQLTVDQVSLLNTDVHICPGQTYQLSSGVIVNTPGTYVDTLRSQASCDSIINTIQLSVDQATFSNSQATICSNQTFQLPSGIVVSTAGTYVDTLRSVASCDSIINSITLVVNNFSSSNQADSIYEGQAYTLPSGVVVSTAGTYQSTLANSVGCDSVITTLLSLKRSVSECLILNNAFSPNGDAINDYWVLYRFRCFKKLSVSVYNRYGSPIYQSDDYNNDWNGSYKNKPSPDGTYYFVLRVLAFDGTTQVVRGNVTLLR